MMAPSGDQIWWVQDRQCEVFLPPGWDSSLHIAQAKGFELGVFQLGREGMAERGAPLPLCVLPHLLAL